MTQCLFLFFPKDPNEIVKTEIYDVRGMLVKTFGMGEEVSADNLEQGIYVVRQIDQDGNATVTKLMNK